MIDNLENQYQQHLLNLEFEGLKFCMGLLQKMDLLFKSLNTFFDFINCNEESFSVLFDKIQSFQ